jgi:uncharacterized repeat protein (TIGR01451 family)
MGTHGPEGPRASKRGIASFVAFLLLFAFALGSGSLMALAGGGSTDPAATGDGGSDDVSRVSALPVPEASSEEAPAADGSGDASITSGAATPVTRSAPSASALKTARTTRDDAVAAPAAPPGGAGLDGGDIDLNYAAAGPFTYDHTTAVGGAWGDGHISKSDGIVESLESGDFQCDDLVVFLTEVTVADNAGSAGAIQLDYSFGAETTGQPGLGFTDILSVGINTGDSGMTDTGGAATAVLTSETPDPPGNQPGYDQVRGVVDIGGLDPGDVIIVRLVVRLGCIQGSNPTGNILNAIEDGRVTSPAADDISVGQQTVPMKTNGFIAAPSITIVKDCPAASAFGDDITYDITITNDGNEDLDTVAVTDTVDGNASVPVAGFPSTLAAGDSFTGSFTYSPNGSEPDPLPNSATVTAQGVFSETDVTDTDGCSTDITHAPAIDVTKTCPQSVPFGDDISYTITVENIGNEALTGVTVIDTLLGDITGDFDVDFSVPFPVGDLATANVTYSPGPGEDPVKNTVTATGFGADSEAKAEDTASCETDVSNPGISIVKTVDEEVVPIGTTVTFTYVVTNTGDVTLYNISVNDDILGHIGDIASLDPGEDATLTKDFVVGDEIVTNIGTAVGHDILGREVSASDDATVSPIAGANPPPNNPPTPFTGSDAGRLGLITMVLLGIGVTVVASTRRRRPKGEAA